MQFLIPLREFFVRNFVTLKSVEVNKYKFYNNTVLYLLSFIPFYFIKLLFNLLSIKYIYKIDNIYFSNYGVSKISPILLNVNAVIDEYNKEDQVRKLNCNHVFHKDCCDNWLLNYSNCCIMCKNVVGKYVPKI